MNTRVPLLICLASISSCHDQKFGTDPSRSDALWIARGPAYGRPAADDATLYFGTTDHRVIAADRSTGTIRWQARTDSVTPRTEFGVNVILVSGLAVFGDYSIYAFDQSSGARKWVFNPERQGIPGFAAGAYELATDAGVIYAGSGSGHAYAIDASSGALIWVSVIAVDGHTSVYDPVVDAQKVYLTVRHFTNPTTGEVVAVDRRSGRVLWSHSFTPLTPLTSSGPLGKLVLFGSLVVAAVDDGRIYALDNSAGAEQWMAPRLPDVLGLDDERPIILAGNVVVAGSDALEVTGYEAATGKQLWQIKAGQGASADQFSTDGSLVCVPFSSGALGGYDAATGNRRWLRSAPENTAYAPSPFIGAEAVFAPSGVGLIAFTK